MKVKNPVFSKLNLLVLLLEAIGKATSAAVNSTISSGSTDASPKGTNVDKVRMSLQSRE